MSFRFLFWTTAFLLIVSGVAGWVFFGEREPDPEELRIQAFQERLDGERAEAAKSDDPAAWTRYARSLLSAPPSLRDPETSLHWLKKAADKGYPPAQVGMGDLYADGMAVKKDPYRAQEWYALAARLSRLAEAHFKVAEGYFRGRGVAQDYAAALTHYRIAAEQGHPVAQYILGSMYEAGWGVERDLITAWIWYSRALPSAAIVDAHEEGYNVRQAFERVTAQMNQSQIEEAKRRLAAGDK